MNALKQRALYGDPSGQARGQALERKDALDAPDDNADVKKTVADFMTAWTEFRAANDQRLAELEKKGAVDPTVTAKLAKIDAALAAGEALSARLTAAEAKTAALDDLQKQLDENEKRVNRISRFGTGSVEERNEARKTKVNHWARGCINAFSIGEANLGEDQRQAMADVAAEYKALGVSADNTGGYLAPSELVAEIIKAITEISAPRQLVRVRSTMNRSIQLPKRTGQFAAVRTTELGTRSETDGLRYGMVEIDAPELYALIDISQQNLEDSAFDLEAEISMEAEEQFAKKEGTEFVTGTGVGEMEGILTNTEIGTTNSGAATVLTADGMFDLKHAIKTAYARSATWILNRTTLGAVRKLKDGNGDYLWMPGIALGRPNVIDGDPYVEVPDMPDEGAGLKPLAYGDWMRGYTMVDRLVMSLLRDPYTQATSGAIRFLFRRRTGGRVVLAEAIRTQTCAA